MIWRAQSSYWGRSDWGVQGGVKNANIFWGRTPLFLSNLVWQWESI
jgi:hypothetical protein